MNEPLDLDAITTRRDLAARSTIANPWLREDLWSPLDHVIRGDVPALLTEVTRLRAENETLRSELDTERHDREQRAASLYDARDALYRGEGPDVVADADIVYGEWLGNRADQIEATP